MAEGPLAALDDRLRPGREPMIILRLRRGVVGVPEGEDLVFLDVDSGSGPPRSRAWTRGGTCVPRHLAQGTACKILDQEAKTKSAILLDSAILIC